MALEQVCQAEIESLHRFFVEWYTGECDDGAFEAFETALAPSFRMVHPDGEEYHRDSIVNAIARAHQTHETADFQIDIEGVELLHDLGDHAVVRYEEWQTLEGARTGRLSTVVFEVTGGNGGPLRWLDVHETWIDPPTG